MLFETVRKNALAYWLEYTLRERKAGDDIITDSFECAWQRGFMSPEVESSDHYSIFCSMGEWNTMVTDFLEDSRCDGLDLSVSAALPQLFRHYTLLLLLVSEIMTDFQDVLTILWTGKPSKDQKDNARSVLSKHGYDVGAVQDLFDYINNVCKHKAGHIHLCNHHIGLCFEDAGSPCAADDAIRLGHLRLFLPHKWSQPAERIATSIIVPKLVAILKYVLDGYNIVDDEFRADSARFEQFRRHYHRVLDVPAAPTEELAPK